MYIRLRLPPSRWTSASQHKTSSCQASARIRTSCSTTWRRRAARAREPGSDHRQPGATSVMYRALRTEEEPYGLMERSPNEVMKVVRANFVYLVIFHLAVWCSIRGIRWAIENPSNSLLWHMGLFKTLLTLPGSVMLISTFARTGAAGRRRQSSEQTQNV